MIQDRLNSGFYTEMQTIIQYFNHLQAKIMPTMLLYMQFRVINTLQTASIGVK